MQHTVATLHPYAHVYLYKHACLDTNLHSQNTHIHTICTNKINILETRHAVGLE